MNAPATFPGGVAGGTLLFTVGNLRCAGCIAKLEGGLVSMPGVIEARVNFTTRRVRVSHDLRIDGAAISDATSRLGFPAEPFLGESDPAVNLESRRLARALAVAGFAAMNIMLLSVSVWSGAQGATRDLFHWLSALIALPTVAYAGRPFFDSAWYALRHGRTNMDVPISIGVILTCTMSLLETATGGAHAYFDGAVMLLFFLLCGRFLDSVMRARAQDGVAALLHQSASRALVLNSDGTTQWRTAAELAPRMIVLVAAGERFAADGIIESGTSSVDRSLITGESAPDPVSTGCSVLAGTINLDGPLTVKLTAVDDTTVIADIARMMESATQGKSRYVRIADRAAKLYAPAVHTLAALSFMGWLISGAGWHQSLLVAVAVLIITCPCALGLAVPVAQVVSAGALMRAGVLIKDGSALERLADADMVLFDKTGTLTLGRPTVSGALPLTNQEKPVALALALASRHPLARALAASLLVEGVKPVMLDKIAEQPGAGMEAMVDGQRARLGRPDWVGGDIIATAHLRTAFAIGDGPVRQLSFEDALRPGAMEAIDRLRILGLSAQIVSGDRASAVAGIAQALKMPFAADLGPADKLARIVQLQDSGHTVLMVGDGLNDGPSLKAAYVSIAPSSASDVGQMAADLVFLGDPLTPVPLAIVAARRTMAVVRQNFGLAIAYNFLAVPLAIAGLVTPLVAALAMSGSSLIVVANALRLRSAMR